MKSMARWSFVLMLAVGLAVSASAQFDMKMPNVRGIWDPALGSGAVYQFDGKQGKGETEYAIVGTESVAGKPGHWLEMAIKSNEGLTVMKTLMVMDSNSLQMKRMIMQPPGEDPMEFPMEMMMRGGGSKETQTADFRNDAELVGSETITVPAGTFTCQHYRMKDKSSDVWVAEKVAPYGLVKMTSKDGNMTLVKVLTNAKTKIRGTPRKFDPMEMMRQRP